MALCRTCHTVIPCHCHLAPPVEIRPGVYQAGRTAQSRAAKTQQPKETRP